MVKLNALVKRVNLQFDQQPYNFYCLSNIGVVFHNQKDHFCNRRDLKRRKKGEREREKHFEHLEHLNHFGHF